MMNRLHSTDDVSAIETQVRPNLLNVQRIHLHVATKILENLQIATICLLLISTGDSHMHVYLRPILPIDIVA